MLLAHPCLFGFLTDLRGEIAELANNLLLVAGGYLVGSIIGWLGGGMIGKWALKQDKPETARKVGRHLGGIILAIIIALVVFTGKGRPTGDGGDGKGSPGNGTTPGRSSPTSTQPSRDDVKISVPQASPKSEATIRVTILAGAAVPAAGKFYILDNDSRAQARNLAEVKKAIEERRAQLMGPATLEVVFPTDPNLRPPANDPKVTDLTRWATDVAKLSVVFPASS